jgi:hypothetical protein
MVECLQCGERRELPEQPCGRCAYVGWAWSHELSEALRRLLRERPVASRRLRSVT